MKRREFITLLGGAAATCPLAARAQQSDQMRRVGFLAFGTVSAWANRIEALRVSLRELGYVEGRNIAIEVRRTENIEQLSALAAELVRLRVDLILAPSSTEVAAAREATSAIPIVFATHADPVGLGHVVSLPRPGGNITGLTVLQTDLTAKALEILKTAVPRATRFGVLWSPTAPSYRPTLQAALTAAEKLGIELQMLPMNTAGDIDAAFVAMSDKNTDAFFVSASSLSRSHRMQLAELALKYRLPSMFGIRDNVEAGGLMSYAPNPLDLTRRAATYIDKIFKGAKPADLPVEQASQFELVLNLKTAKALGLEIPPTLLAIADEVIE
jgi:putative ABC transport system substrate-binding protein